MPLPLRLAAFVLLLSFGYYAVVAFFPHWLRPQLGAFPFSLLLGFGIFVTGAAVSLFYAFLPSASARKDSAPPEGDV